MNNQTLGRLDQLYLEKKITDRAKYVNWKYTSMLLSTLVALYSLYQPTYGGNRRKHSVRVKRHTISVNVGGLLSGATEISIQTRLSDYFMLAISPTVVYWGYGSDQMYGGGLGIGIDYFPFSKKAVGFHLRTSIVPVYLETTLLQNIAPNQISGQSVRGPPTEKNISHFGLGAKASAAYRWRWDNGLRFSMGLGIQGFDLDSNIKAKLHGILPSLEIGIGYAF